jgi:hypothetical protein
MSVRMSKSADVGLVTQPNGAQVGAGADGDAGAQAGTPGTSANPLAATVPPKAPKEIGGPPGPEPTRYGDWQYKGRVTDF